MSPKGERNKSLCGWRDLNNRFSFSPLLAPLVRAHLEAVDDDGSFDQPFHSEAKPSVVKRLRLAGFDPRRGFAPF